MKRLIATLILILFLSSPAFAFRPDEYAVSSDEQTATATIYTGAAYIYGILVSTDGTNAVTELSVYDNTSASGTEIIPTMVITTASDDRVQYIRFDPPVACNTGIHVVATGTGDAYVVYYRAK